MYYSSVCLLVIHLADILRAFHLPFIDETGACMDRMTSCGRIGRKLALSRCYESRFYSRCCATCDRMKLPIDGCEYGDLDPLCENIGKTEPVADCYAQNQSCCQTCHLYDSGVPGCPYGDRASWCTGIGDRYSVQSCYDHDIHCCATCRRHRTNIPGCPYGDRMPWCAGVGIIYTTEICSTNPSTCCQTCHRLLQKVKSTTTVLVIKNTPRPTRSSQHLSDHTTNISPSRAYGEHHTPTHGSVSMTTTTYSDNKTEVFEDYTEQPKHDKISSLSTDTEYDILTTQESVYKIKNNADESITRNVHNDLFSRNSEYHEQSHNMVKNKGTYEQIFTTTHSVFTDTIETVSSNVTSKSALSNSTLNEYPLGGEALKGEERVQSSPAPRNLSQTAKTDIKPPAKDELNGGSRFKATQLWIFVLCILSNLAVRIEHIAQTAFTLHTS